MSLSTNPGESPERIAEKYAHKYFDKIVSGEMNIRELTSSKPISDILVVKKKGLFGGPKFTPIDRVEDIQQGMDIMLSFKSAGLQKNSLGDFVNIHNVVEASIANGYIIVATQDELLVSPDLQIMNTLAAIFNEKNLQMDFLDISGSTLEVESESVHQQPFDEICRFSHMCDDEEPSANYPWWDLYDDDHVYDEEEYEHDDCPICDCLDYDDGPDWQ